MSVVVSLLVQPVECMAGVYGVCHIKGLVEMLLVALYQKEFVSAP